MSTASSWSDAPNCTICLENIIEGRNRSIARLQCGHIFHLDCIGSEFNFNCAMRCPNCRQIENGQWLYAAGGYSQHVPEATTELVDDGGHYHILLPTGREWCPQLNAFRDSREQIRELLLIQLGYNIRSSHSRSHGSAVFHVIRVEPHHPPIEEVVAEPVVLTPWGPALTSSLGSDSSSSSNYQANISWHQQTLRNSPSVALRSWASGVRPATSGVTGGVTMQPGEMSYLAQLGGGLSRNSTHSGLGEAVEAPNAGGQASGEEEMHADEYNCQYSMHRSF